MTQQHEDECITLCPIAPSERCRIGHGCWCAECPPSAPTRDSLVRDLALVDMDGNGGAEHEILGNFVGMAQGVLRRELLARQADEAARTGIEE